jgi:hypothetical protein
MDKKKEAANSFVIAAIEDTRLYVASKFMQNSRNLLLSLCLAHIIPSYIVRLISIQIQTYGCH